MTQSVDKWRQMGYNIITVRDDKSNERKEKKMNEEMTNEQFTKVLDILEKSIEEIIRNTEDKEEMIEKIKELLNK